MNHKDFAEMVLVALRVRGEVLKLRLNESDSEIIRVRNESKFYENMLSQQLVIDCLEGQKEKGGTHD